jgi:hypothetical protein
VRGDRLETLMREMATITAANVTLAQYHHERRTSLS